MIQPYELTLNLPMEVANGVMSTTTRVWEILHASYRGDVSRVKELCSDCPELLYAQYNYAPPIHFAVREGHVALVKYLLDNGAYDPTYKTYPFLDSLETFAEDRGHTEIAEMLASYSQDRSLQKFKGDNGQIYFNRTPLQQEFEQAVDRNDLIRVKEILATNPDYAKDQTFFWGEGILAMPVKENHRDMIELLIRFGAKAPDTLKWAHAYYFEKYEGAEMMLPKGLNPNVTNWNHTSILHALAHYGDVKKAELLIQSGASVNAVDEEYQSTPLGLATRSGKIEMVKYLLSRGADVTKSGSPWAKPLAWARKKQYSEIESILLIAGE